MFGVSRMHLLLYFVLSLLSPLQNAEDLVSENALLKEQIEIMEETAVCDPLFFIKEFK